jgi:hypothetical protein
MATATAQQTSGPTPRKPAFPTFSRIKETFGKKACCQSLLSHRAHHRAEMALARLAGVAGLVPSVDGLLYRPS